MISIYLLIATIIIQRNKIPNKIAFDIDWILDLYIEDFSGLPILG